MGAPRRGSQGSRGPCVAGCAGGGGCGAPGRADPRRTRTRSLGPRVPGFPGRASAAFSARPPLPRSPGAGGDRRLWVSVSGARPERTRRRGLLCFAAALSTWELGSEEERGRALSVCTRRTEPFQVGRAAFWEGCTAVTEPEGFCFLGNYHDRHEGIWSWYLFVIPHYFYWLSVSILNFDRG
jgi:hypothetical protein